MHGPARLSLLLLALVAATAGACREGIVRPVNRSPVVVSLGAFPAVIHRADSVLVTCEAWDPDGDSLVYDWTTDSRLRIQGDVLNQHSLSNTPDKQRVFYPDYAFQTVDTAWVSCLVRDRRGGGAYAGYVTVVIEP